jgi:hypothetical protein
MLHNLDLQLVTDVSGQPIGPTKGQASTAWPLKKDRQVAKNFGY